MLNSFTHKFLLKPQRFTVAMVSIIILIMMSSFSAMAGTKTWSGATNTTWSTGSNWVGGVAPASGDDVLIPGGGTNYPVINATVSIRGITVNSTGSGGRLTVTFGGILTASGLITVKAGGFFYHNGGTSNLAGLTVVGTLNVSGGTILSDVNLNISSGGVVNQSGGIIHLASATGTSPTDHLIIAASGTFNQSGGTFFIKDWLAGAGTFNQTNASALFKLSQNWKPGAGSVFNSTAGTVQFTSNASSGNFAAGTRQFNNIIIDAGVNPDFSNTTASTIPISGNFTNNNTGIDHSNKVTFTFNGTGTQTIYSASTGTRATFGYLVINKPSGTATLTSNAYVVADMSVISGTYDISTYISNRKSSGGALVVSSGASLLVKGSTGGVTGSNFPLNFTTVTLDNTSTVDYAGANQTVASYEYGHLSLSASTGAAVKTMPATALAIDGNLTSYKGPGTSVSFTAASAFTVLGSVNIGVSTTFVGGAYTHNIAGNWTNNGTFTATSNTINLNGTNDQAVNASTFNNLTANKATGSINLSGDVTVNATLTFTKGVINTSSYKVISANGGTLSGAAQGTGWVNGNLQKYYASTAGGTFQVGGGNYYSPLSLTFASVTTAGSLIASATASSHPNVATSTIATKNISRYWTLSKPGAGAIVYTTATITFNWNVVDNYSGMTAASLDVANYASSAWSYPAVSGTPTSTSAVAELVSNTGDFAIGEITACTISSGFTYTSNNLCSNGGTANITLSSGATAGTFTASPAGLSINSSTGAINLGASTAGLYTVTNTATSGPCTSATNFNLNVNAAPSASISYTGGPFCTSAGTASVTRTGTAGGTYSSTMGLDIHSTTGAVTLLNSTPGTYTVTYTILAANGCAQYTTTTSVTVVAQPDATISYDGTPYCLNGGFAPVSQSGTTGGTYSSTAGLSINSTTGTINLTSSSAGTYTVTYTIAAANGCTLVTATTSVSLSSATATTISYSGSPFCKTVGPVSVTFSGAAGGSYSSTAGLDLDETTGEIDPSNSTAGNYTITYTFAGTCTVVATTSVTITAAPSATISYTGTPYCSNAGTASVTRTGTTGGTYSSTAGLTINASTGAITLASSTAGTYTVSYTIAAVGGCTAQTATTSVTITTLPVATISYSGSPFCKSVGTAQPVTQTGTAGGVYSSTAGLSIDATTGDIIPATSVAGSYTVTYTMAATGGCTAQTATTSVTITPVPTATFSYPGSPYSVTGGTASVSFSGTAGGTYSSTAGLTLNATTGDVTLSSSTPGTYTVTYTVAAAGGCAVYTVTASITVVVNTKIFTGTGNFSDPARWTGGTLPITGENLVIDGACTVDNSVTTDNIVYGTLIIGTATGRTFNWIASGTNRLNVSNVSAGAGASALDMTNGGTLVIRGTWSTTNLAFTPGAGTIELQSTITLPEPYTTYKNITINGSGITVRWGVATTVSGNLTIITGTLNSNDFNLSVKGNWINDVSTTAFTAGIATVTFNGTTAQSIAGSFATTFNDLTIANATSSVTLNTNQSVAGNLSVTAGTLDIASFTADRATAGGTLSLSNNTFLRIGATNTFPANFTTNTMTIASTVEYYGTNQTVAAKTYGNLTLSSASGDAVKTFAATAFAIAGNLTSTVGTGTSVTFTAAAILTITGNVTLGASTTFNGGSFAHSVAGNWVNSGTFNGNTGTVTFSGNGKGISGSGTQNFNNLTVSASLFTFSNGSISVSGDLATISSGSFIQAAGGTLLMSGTAKTISGTGISIDNLTVSGTVTTAASFSLTGNLSVSGSITASAGNISMGGASKTISGAGSIAFAGLSVPGSITTAASFSIANSLNVIGSFSASAGTATFTGTSTLSGTADLFSTTINGTSLQLSANSILGIANALTITAGTLNVTSSIPNTVNFNGPGAQNINAISYDNLVLSNGNTKTAVEAITTYKDITIETGTNFTASSFTHLIYGDWHNNGTFTAGTGTIEFTGPATAYLTGATTFNILTSNTSSVSTELILNDNVSAAIVNMTNGIIRTGTDTITITNTRTGNGFIYGNIQRNHSFTTGVAYAFEGPNNTVNFSAVSGVNSITVSAVQTAVVDFPFGNAIGRYYNIAVPSGTYTATLRLHYEDDELNGNPENDMGMWNYDSTQWLPVGKTANDSVANYVEQSGLTNITNRWTCSINPTVVLWSGTVSSDWNTSANWTVYVGSGSTPPAATDVVVLGGLATYQPTISTTVNIKNLVFVAEQQVTLTMASGGSLTAGDMQGVWYNNASHTINTNGQTFTINGNMSLSDGVAGHAIDLNIGSGTVTVSGSLVQTGGANINFSSAGTLNIHQNFEHSSGTFTAGSGTVNYNGDQNQHVAAVNYNNLSINKTAGISTIDSVVNIAGNLLISSGELDNLSSINITGNVTIEPGATLYNNYMMHVGGNWLNTGTYIGTGAHIKFNGSGTQTISASTFNNLEIIKPVGSTAVLTGNLIIKGDLTVHSGTLDIKSFSCDRMVAGGNLTLEDSATFIVGANNAPFNFTSGSLANSSTVIADGTGPQAIYGESFGNVIFRNAGLKTLITPITVNGTLTIENGAVFDGGSQALTLNGNWVNNGSFTPSASTILCTGIGKTISGVSTFHRFSVYGSYTLLSNLTFDSLLIINSTGSLSAAAGINVTMNGDLINSGILYTLGTTTFTGNVLQTLSLINAVQTIAITVNFNGSVSPLLNSTSTPQFGFLNINNTGGVNPSVGWTIAYGLTVGSGATFNGGISTHNILGSVTNNGTITSDGTLNFIPASAAAINLGNNFSSTGLVNFGGAGVLTLASNPLSFHDMQISNSNVAGISPASDWTIVNNFTVTNNATFNAGSRTYFVGNDATNLGTINNGTSTFKFNGSANQTIGGMTFYNLEAANTGAGIALLSTTVNNDLAVSTGVLSIGNNTISRTVAINGNLSIANGSTLNVDTASNTTHQLTVSGNIINTGTLNMRPDANSLCNVTFNKVGTQTISGTGSTTSFNNITVNMGVADTNHVDVTATNFSAPNGFLTLNNGSFNLNNAAVSITPFAADITTGNFLIPATAGLWVNAGIINSANMNWTVAGTVKVAGGTLNMGNSINNVVIPKATAHILVNSGNLNLASAISSPGAAWACNMQGGTMTVNTQGSDATGIAPFNMDASGSSFSMSGGTLIIKDPGGIAGQNLGYKNLATAGSGFTGGTLQIGNSMTTASSVFGLVSTNPIYNLTVNSGNATAILQAPVFAVSNNVTVALGNLNIDTLTLKIGGAISNSGVFIAANGTIEMNGTTAQTIPAAAFQGNNLKGLTVNNNAGVTLAGAINLTDVLTVSNGSLAADGFLTLKSTATGTARVAPITSAAAIPISGNITAERYVPGRRKYRLITSPVTTSFSSTLTAGEEALSIWGNWQNSGINTTANVGELITGGSVADGFDQGTTNASLYTYDDVNRVFKGYTTANGKNTKYTPLKAGIAYLMFVYGDRRNTVFTSNPNSTVLNAKGTLKTGDQIYNTGSAITLTGVTGRFTLLGNPFASPINWATIPKTNLANSYWGWDPNLSSTGGYITVTTLGAVTISAPYSGSTGLNQYIQSGQGFFVKTTGASPVLTIREQDKVSNFNATAYRGNLTAGNIPLIAINLQYVSSGTKVLADGVLAVFDPSFSNTAGVEDAGKLANSAETISILNDTTLLSIDARKMPKNNDTLFLNVLRLTKPQYTLQIFAEEMVGTGVQAFLQDRYLNTLQSLSLGDTNNIVINVSTGIPASVDKNRFRIVFQSSVVVLPLKFISVKATPKNKDIQVDWSVAEESGVKKYEIERSDDGISFIKAGEVAARGNNTNETYNWLDVHPVAGDNYYRIRAIDVDGKFLLSKIVFVKLSTGNTSTAFKIFPNPVTNYQVNIRADEMAKGKYSFVLYNQHGQQIIQRMIDHSGGTFIQIIELSKTMAGGIYYLFIAGETEKYTLTVLVK